MAQTLPYQQLTTCYYALTAVVLPVLAFAVNFFLKKGKAAGWISTIAIGATTVFAAIVFKQQWNAPLIHATIPWFTIGGTAVNAGILLNNLSVLLLLLVNVIALPVHIYSMAYMSHDEGFSRYFTYLSFFCFSMLALVVVDNLVLFYAFWELVGFSSYLLIGFWFTRDKAVQANKKAFIMNRIGDVGLLIAIMVLFSQYHTFDLNALFSADGLVANSTLTNGLWINGTSTIPAVWQYLACAGLFLAVAAKSAQFPLHTWLPDAMEGPTSVSALIHAATMVAAGIFLLGRVYPLFSVHELDALAIIGCFTAFMAASIAITQNDLKRILAFSTISQLGFMVMAMGIGAYASSLFHLVTHAFFKCLLFLVAGAVIHEMQHIRDENKLDFDPQNILYMGGLRRKMPITFITAVIAGLALVGLPFTSGYLSKDGILIQAFEWSDTKAGVFKIIPILTLITSWLTAFYVARLVFKVFFGKFRLSEVNPGLKLHVHDGPWKFNVPMIFLAICCLFPVFSLNPFLYEHAWIYKSFLPSNFLERMNPYHTIIPIALNILSLLVIYWAYAVYVLDKKLPLKQNNWLFAFSYYQWYFNEAYQKVFVQPVLAISTGLFAFDRKGIDGLIHFFNRIILWVAKLSAAIDRYVVDGFLHFVVALVRQIGNFARSFQTGRVQYYLLTTVVAIVAWVILKILI
ncbi:NADH-quinone oxidoreductase subunit L [Mucilaginibacter sp. RS28]|uniref:NADH-quinone oxidoreductase subunit L n=1 Tax=Mucilaginibacter straminoryzae TaxID=2932774 RepID=A0A9X2BDB3_9SPHI|nr:NADH-quinone oxidoreductase subunit L [Mucilaginibacter straminoryzae]MCJ8210138.1 NADH-quinone oxidoreductase subunit L [Mucilaginibacter straminoryzae]